MNEIRHKQGTLFIISAPSGTGKTTLVKALLESELDLKVSVSYTTRPKRLNEEEGIAYHFIDEATFQEMAQQDSFLEYATVFDYHYGTPRHWVEEQLAAGTDIILEIDWQGAQQIKQSSNNTISLFILPPSFQALEQRLQKRGEDQTTVQRRMRDARNELSHYHEYDYLVINENLDATLREIEAIILAKRHNYRLQQQHFDNFARQLMAQAENIQ